MNLNPIESSTCFIERESLPHSSVHVDMRLTYEGPLWQINIYVETPSLNKVRTLKTRHKTLCYIIYFQEVKCEDGDLQNVIQTAVTKLYQAIAPIKPSMELSPFQSSASTSQMVDTK